MPNWNDDHNRSDRDQNFSRSEDRRRGDYGQSSYADRTYDPNRYRSPDDRGYSSFDRDSTSPARGDRTRDFSRDWGRDFGHDMNRDYRSQSHGYERDQNPDFGRDLNRDYNRSGSRDSNRDTGYRSRESGYGSGMGVGRSSTYSGGHVQSRDMSRDQSRDMSYGQGGDLSNVGMMNSNPTRGQFAGRGPKGWRRSDDRIKEEVCDVLERHPAIDASEIEVEVKEGMVTLRGSVDERQQKRMAEDMIEHLSGVLDVRNEITVSKGFFEKAKEVLTGESESTDTAKTGKSARTSSTPSNTTSSPH